MADRVVLFRVAALVKDGTFAVNFTTRPEPLGFTIIKNLGCLITSEMDRESIVKLIGTLHGMLDYLDGGPEPPQ